MSEGGMAPALARHSERECAFAYGQLGVEQVWHMLWHESWKGMLPDMLEQFSIWVYSMTNLTNLTKQA